MRFGLSETADALRGAVAELLDAEVTPDVVRAGWPEGDPALVGDAWRKLAAVGVTGTLVPEDLGGLGLDENSLVPMLAEIGRSGLPVPAAETIAVAAPLLAGGHLPGVLDGDTLVTAQLGDSDLVPFGQQAALVVLRDGGALRLFPRDALVLEPCVTTDGSRGTARLVSRPEARDGMVLTDDPAEVDGAWQRGVLGTSALLIGLADRMLTLTVGYVGQREQFGRPIGSFQAIKHALADALVGVEFARPMLLAAAWAQSQRSDEATARTSRAQTSVAKVLASDAARLVARTAIQCHGAIAYTTEYDLHLYAKQAWALIPAWGGPAWHRARVAEFLGASDD
ncbi:MAG TPA: acyl-CoA dehydrogenase family protein [Streptosporangiaceae bacterium]|nr:acyl-CoA dehydrogenase family protein [Streptosporangiaceae bacterium]